MARPMQTVKIYGVQDRRSTKQAKLPRMVRYIIDGRHRSKSFRTRIEAERYRGLLLQAVQDGGRFDDVTGEPESWQTPLADLHVHEWSRRWLCEQWAEWQPRTRASATEALARFISIAVDPGAKPPDGLRVYLQSALAPGTDGGHSMQHERWMTRHCLTLRELDRERVADIDRKLGLKLDGSQLAANTTSRIRIVDRASVQAAIDGYDDLVRSEVIVRVGAVDARLASLKDIVRSKSASTRSVTPGRRRGSVPLPCRSHSDPARVVASERGLRRADDVPVALGCGGVRGSRPHPPAGRHRRSFAGRLLRSRSRSGKRRCDRAVAAGLLCQGCGRRAGCG